MTDAADHRSSPQADLDRPELAFEAMTHKLAVLIAAVEGFAARQQELHSRDYTQDLARSRQHSGHSRLKWERSKLAARSSKLGKAGRSNGCRFSAKYTTSAKPTQSGSPS